PPGELTVRSRTWVPASGMDTRSSRGNRGSVRGQARGRRVRPGAGRTERDRTHRTRRPSPRPAPGGGRGAARRLVEPGRYGGGRAATGRPRGGPADQQCRVGARG